MVSENDTKTLLDEAIRASRIRAGASETLSGECRSAIFAEVTGPGPAPRRLRGLFTPWRRVALGGAIPLALAAVLVGWTALEWNGGISPSIPSVDTAKVGDHVVFTIANGDREHVIVKSDRPDRFDRSAAAKVTDGSFSDRLDSGSDLVFYRID
jgi:hypothetical protein